MYLTALVASTSIGLLGFSSDSTFTELCLRVKNLTANPLKIKPAVLQVELNYWNPQPELVKVRCYRQSVL